MQRKFNKFPSILFISALVFSHHLSASNLNYNYAEAARLKSEIDVSGFDVDGDGFGFIVSRDIASNLAVFFSYEEEDFDFDFEGKALALGVDFHIPIAEIGDLVIGLSAADVEISQPVLGSEDDTGNAIELGIRSRLNEFTELELFYSRVEAFDDEETSYSLGLNLGDKEGIQLTLGFNTSDDSDTMAIGIRANY